MSEPAVANALPVVQLYDTLSANKRDLHPLEPGVVGIYTCGPTVYDMSHIGHARAALVPDILVRFLRAGGYRVKYVRNITDVDDKIIKRSREQGIGPGELAEQFVREYHRDMDDLGMLRPDVEPRVTQHMAEIVDMVGRLVDAGYAYPVDGDVYYRVARFEPYGCLSKRNLDELQAGARVEIDARKENPLDFALWKAAKTGEPSWDSPWGPGRPGWHIECSVMSTAQLGEAFDVHGGGRDLIFPHHENEIAQSQALSGTDSYARHWVHNGFVNFAGEKMSKSLGNFFTIREVTTLYHPLVVRFFLLGVHYRSGVNFDVEVTCPGCEAVLTQADQDAETCSPCGRVVRRDELRGQVRFPGLEQADDRLASIYETMLGAREFLSRTAGRPAGDGPVVDSVAGMRDAFWAAMTDDLNTAAALAALSDPLTEVNRLLASGKGVDPAMRARTIDRFVTELAVVADVLGMFHGDPGAYLLARRDLKAARIGLDVARVQDLVVQRRQAREQKDWETADRLRDELGSMGVTIRDGAEQTSWTL